MALARGARAVALVGDHRQLPPTVLSRAAELGGMSLSLFDRLQAGSNSSLLATSYDVKQDTR